MRLRYLLRGLPLGELTQTFLPRPHACVDDLEEQLARSRVEDENRAVDGLGRQVTLERLSTLGRENKQQPVTRGRCKDRGDRTYQHATIDIIGRACPVNSSSTTVKPALTRGTRGHPVPPTFPEGGKARQRRRIHAVRQRRRPHPTKTLVGMATPRLRSKHAVHLRASSASHLVDRHPVHVAVVDEPDDLVGEQLAVVLARQVRLGWLGAGGGKHRNATQHVSGL